LAALTSDQDLAAIGFAFQSSYDAASDPKLGPSPDPSEQISLRYLVGPRQFDSALPRFPAGRLDWVRVSNDFADLLVLASRPDVNIALRNNNPVPPHTDSEFRYSGVGTWASGTRSTSFGEGLFAYGLPTAPGALPASGERFFAAAAQARELNPFQYSEAGAGPDAYFGRATLSFNFATGAVEGALKPVVVNHWYGELPLGEFSFVDARMIPGTPTFSGQLVVPDTNARGWFEGRFTGPNADEVIIRWQAPYFNVLTERWGSLSGVLVGRSSSG
jgi:hypothetical protein